MSDVNLITAVSRRCGSKSIAFAVLVWTVLAMPSTCRSVAAEDEGASPSLPRIAAGTKVDDPKATRWNRVVLLSKPRIATGEVDQLSETIRKASTAFTLTILATVEPYSATDGSRRFRLAEVGVGYSAPVNGVQTIISYDTVQAQGADPGFIGRQVLSENEEQLKSAVIVVRSSTLLVFDTPAILHRHGKHRDYTARHLVWIDPLTGRGATAVWLLGKDDKDRLRPVNEPLKLVATGTREDRVIHVDGNEFTLGIPSQRAFALESLPPGRAIDWTAGLAKVAALPNYTAQTLGDLSSALNQAIQASREQETASN